VVDHGPLLARGRDADIYDLGAGLVLRRARDGRSLAGEAAVMAHAHGWGVPVPAVHEVTGDGAIVMDRIAGPLLLDQLSSRPWRLGAAARTLVELHAAVHRVPAPPGVRASGLSGDRLLHLDLHPLNVVLSADGPVLIDWSNARAGPPAADLAMTWILLATGTVGGPWPVRAATAVFRRRMVASFLAGVDRSGAAATLPEVARWRLADPNVTAAEAAQVRSLTRRVSWHP
jgi:aminoglycoside phosphotransferase (APT) family kinase protein